MKKCLILFALLTAAGAAHAQFYVGAGAGYLIDSEEEYLTARLGYALVEKENLTHALEVEVGFLSDSEYGATIDLVPVMGNYRATTTLNEKLNVYFGAGAGVTFLDVKVYGYSESDTSFSAQAFTGLEYRPNASVSLTLGVRYLWIDEAYGIDIGDDVGVEAGIRIRF